MIKHFTSLLCMLFLSAQGQCLVWSDEFDGSTIDPSKWAFQTGNGCPDLCGWGNGELENYTNSSKNARVANGILILEAVKESSNGSSFTSAKLNTLGLASWTYGRFEARMRMPLGLGLWPAFWMLSDNNNWPMTGEIDIMEYRGDQPKQTDATLHYGSAWPNNQHDGSSYMYTQNLSSDFHVYAVEWEASEIRFYFDDVLIKKETKSPNSLNPPSTDNPWPWSTKFYFILNLAVGGGFTGNPAAADVALTKSTFEIDYVRVYNTAPQTLLIFGPKRTFTQVPQTYSVPDVTGTTYNWQVTDGTIVSGQNTHSAGIKWDKALSSIVTLQITPSATTGCSSTTATLSQKVNTFNDSCVFMYQDFEGRPAASLSTSSGQAAVVNNPKSNTVNNTSKALQYVRSSATTYDVLFLDTALVSNGAAFEAGTYTFEMDVYNTRAAGTPVEIQLASTAYWNDTWPAGRHSTYTATTTKSNQWETLRFTFSQVGDPNRSQFQNALDRIIVMLNPNSNTGDTYYIDRLKKVAVNAANCTLTNVEDQAILATQLYPQPFQDILHLKFGEASEMHTLLIKDLQGLTVKQFRVNSSDTQLELSGLAQGIYFLEVLENGTSKTYKIVKQ